MQIWAETPCDGEFYRCCEGVFYRHRLFFKKQSVILDERAVQR